jgi:hypothetical protein
MGIAVLWLGRNELNQIAMYSRNSNDTGRQQATLLSVTINIQVSNEEAVLIWTCRYAP